MKKKYQYGVFCIIAGTLVTQSDAVLWGGLALLVLWMLFDRFVDAITWPVRKAGQTYFDRKREALKDDLYEAAVKSGRREMLYLYVTNRPLFEAIVGEYLEACRATHQRNQEPAKKPWWEVLGVPKNATEAERQRAYRNLAKEYHPDNKETGDEEMMAELNRAKEEAGL